jgi:hypothetical protein
MNVNQKYSIKKSVALTAVTRLKALCGRQAHALLLFTMSTPCFSYDFSLPKHTVKLALADEKAPSDSWEEEFDDAAKKTSVKKEEVKKEDKKPEEKKAEAPDDLTEKIYETQSGLAVTEKSVYLATILSLFIGFGLGNFYADDPFPGYIAMITELVGIGVLAAGVGMYYYDEEANLSDSVITPSEGLLLGGGVLFFGMRLYATVNSAFAAHAYNKRTKIKPFSLYPYYRKYNESDTIGLALNF